MAGLSVSVSLKQWTVYTVRMFILQKDSRKAERERMREKVLMENGICGSQYRDVNNYTLTWHFFFSSLITRQIELKPFNLGCS